jgi:phospholipase C
MVRRATVNLHQRPDDPIKHVILLMFENHSFEQLLGCFKRVYPDLAGVDPDHPAINRYDAQEYRQGETTERQMILDPRHEVNHVAVQMEDHNGGFVKDFIDANKNDKKITPAALDEHCRFLMGYYPLDFLLALHRLARDFLICDHWFSSIPGPTWPNRFFALSGTSSGRVNMPEDGEHQADLEGWFQQNQDTIFDRLSEKGISWKVYFHDIPQSICLVHQRRPENTARYTPFEQFLQDAAGPEDAFPAFCFIEPDYNGVSENDDHPPHDVMKAQKLLADVYSVIRSNADLWAATLLVVLYDEHGGFFDHVEPPDAVPPSPPQPNWEEQQFNWFSRLGIRVPALLVSPWVKRRFDATSFDHTSLLKYLTEKWGLGPLGDRVASPTTNSIGGVITEVQPRPDTVEKIELTKDQLTPPNPDLEEQAAAYITSHHKALALIGQRLELELLRESPVTFAWVKYPLESLLHWLLRLGNKWVFRMVHARTKANWQKFRSRRCEQAIPKLADIIRHAEAPVSLKRFAAETLGMVTGLPFHLDAKPVEAAIAWFDEHLPK